MRFVAVSLCAGMLLLGCQSSGPADPPATPASGQMASQTHGPGPVGIDDDSDPDPPGLLEQAVLAPVQGLGEVVGQALSGPARAIRYASGDTPGRAARLMRDRNSADNRRTGINQLLTFDYASKSKYTAAAFEAMGETDQDPTVRAAALRACNRLRDRRATPVFIKSLSDPSEWVRLEAAKGLANVPDPAAAPVLMRVATDPDETRDVRITAADALKYYQTQQVARALSMLVSDPDFSVAWQARRSLVRLTHKDFGYDEHSWLGYFAGPGRFGG